MRYDDDAYREVFPKKIEKPIIKVETPIETFMPSVEQAEEVDSVKRTEEQSSFKRIEETVNDDLNEKGE